MNFPFAKLFHSDQAGGAGRLLRYGAYGAVVLSAGLVAAGASNAATGQSAPGPLATKYSGSAVGAELKATNTGTKLNDTYGVEGVVTKARGGIGVYGYGDNKTLSTYGLYGSALDPNAFGGYGIAQYPASALKSSTPDPSTESVGLGGVSLNASGVEGETKYPNTSDGFSIGGVIGIDETTSSLSGTNNNNGVLGITNFGYYGVAGEGGTNAVGGVLGEASLFGVYGYGYTVGSAATATGAAGSSSGLDYMGTDPTGKYIEFSVDNQGDLFFTGSVASIVKTPGGGLAQTYMPRSAEPVVEDYGQAELRAGSAYVRLDPTFGSTIDQRSSYMVYVTPDGENHGIYVTGKSRQGFWVRESYGGRSSIPFDYRVVAVPSGQTGTRMAFVEPQTFNPPGRSLTRANRAMAAQMSALRSGRQYSPSLFLGKPSSLAGAASP